MASRRFIGAVLGLLGLVAGAVCFSLEEPLIGALAGLFALAAGVMAHTAEARSAGSEARAEEVRAELDRTIADRDQIRDDLQAERQRQETAVEAAPAPPMFAEVTPAVDHNQTDVRLLTDPETNLFSEAYFRVALDARIASARRHLRPVAVALIEVVEGARAVEGREADPVKVTSSIRQTLRDADTACRMSDGCFALILEDTPENGAVWTVERIRRNLTARHGQHTMWAGVACYPAHAFSTDEILDQAEMALESAREWKQDRIEIATAE